ncbi:MAG: hypothetical protein A2745_02840 [Candidatus Harrisonbacteria bacterium RIFCSPHIGHO2_01_FULL_44_13]|uniref:Type II secretion system protein GspF domain-containing protein n=1 Tax=Candidatus Harrisonbacteria bacterium RIFCSPLOWO2_01_FULL_44_18 TaxID=1798407 RepID=A0A1G1ZNT1_9BACT|nr:MAG: hypothetical protein A2745_02840 [Candidatus Harrisonbacteria bacterium RIFCSPHIGHO2_01_FULL_44_13]OGY65517.1 MAG: hypothetical protein A3A16_01470 [Candidatus Harrisonbacteria bacterium RIFCSPLOWO2_01_FULL_44_18]
MTSFSKNLFLRVPLQEKMIFARHLSIMIKAGMPLLDAITMLQKQTGSRSLAKILKDVAADINNGQFLSKSLEKYQDVFGNLFVNIIRVGETGGILPENLNFLSEELSKKAELRRKVIGAMVYPIVILAATFGVVGMLIVFVFPKILPVFASLNVKLPATTKLLIAISNLLTQRGVLVLAVAAAAILAFWLLLKIKTVKFYYHWFLLRTPILGKMARNVNMANFTRTLGLLLKSGIKIVESLDITSETLSNLVYVKELKTAAVNIQKGELISKYLSSRPNLFPPMLANMIAVGENTGNLSETLLYLSEFYENEVGDAAKNLSNVLEPIMMVTLGLIVGFVAISIISPIYQATQTIGR